MRNKTARTYDCRVNGDRYPDLRLHCVFGRAEKCFDPQVLFDPFEEKFNLPRTLHVKRQLLLMGLISR